MVIESDFQVDMIANVIDSSRKRLLYFYLDKI